MVVHAALGGVLLHGVLAGVRGVSVGGQVARLHRFLLCGFDLLEGVVAGVVLGVVVAVHLQKCAWRWCCWRRARPNPYCCPSVA